MIHQVPAGQNTLAPPVMFSAPTQDLTSLLSGTTVFGSSKNGYTDFGNAQSGLNVGTSTLHATHQ